MKKLRVILCLVFYASMSLLVPTNLLGDSYTHETVHIKADYQGHGQVDRSNSLYVYEFIIRELGSIELEYNGLDSPDIYIVDSNGQIITWVQTNAYSSTEHLSVPTNPGKYAIIICSDNYYGEGVFTVN